MNRASISCETTLSSLIKVKLQSLKGGGWTEKTFEEIMTENFQNLMKTINPQRISVNSKAQNMKKIILRHIIINYLGPVIKRKS